MVLRQNFEHRFWLRTAFRALSFQHLWLVLCTGREYRTGSLQSVEVTAEDYGRAPKVSAIVCFYKWGTSSTLVLNLTKTPMCNSKFGISGLMYHDRVLDDVRDSHYEMNKKRENWQNPLLEHSAPWVSHVSIYLSSTKTGSLCSWLPFQAYLYG